MSTISYKGYQAEVAYDEGRLFVRVLHVDDVLVAHCDKASEVDDALRELIDDYLEDCRSAGRVPTKPFSGSFNVRVPKDIHRRIAMAAAHETISLNQWVGRAVVEKLDCSHVATRVDGIFARKHEEIALLRLTQFASWSRPVSMATTPHKAWLPKSPQQQQVSPWNRAES